MPQKRKLMMFNRVTPEGFFADADGGLDWVVPEPGIDKAGAAAIPATDTVLFGRKTYEQFASFWPKVLASGENMNPHGPGIGGPEMRAMAEGLTAMKKVVYSRTLTKAPWKNTQIVAKLDPAAVAAMKAQPGKDMIIFGSGSIVRLLTQHGLIDEYQFVVGPVLLGRGQMLFHDVSARTKLELVEARPYPSGNLVLRYARKE